ncbi:VRR-NUC domain containing protein [uncultured Caudovirales phage]|uniref:VRR-NUC domain containing protein n=1 Tax=uncultured Caudovirales phage TaxID=2100421 RepID=A0A6J5LH34_9CAUD|nr:VRR-NUC domain containing protein [uncultured Caudovirales phage]
MSKLPCLTEFDEGKQLVAYLRLRNIAFTHVGNETGSSMEAKRRAVRMKQSGVSRGFPDYVVALPGIGVAYIELKRVRGSATSPEQKAWIEILNTCPAAEARVCKGFDEARAFIEELLPLPKSTVDTGSIF